MPPTKQKHHRIDNHHSLGHGVPTGESSSAVQWAITLRTFLMLGLEMERGLWMLPIAILEVNPLVWRRRRTTANVVLAVV